MKSDGRDFGSLADEVRSLTDSFCRIAKYQRKHVHSGTLISQTVGVMAYNNTKPPTPRTRTIWIWAWTMYVWRRRDTSEHRE